MGNRYVDRIWELYYRGIPTYEIARLLNISEYEVVKVLGY